jgi:hydroxymethylpyrimidine pyrophosphatase-like HAD family hydrolase
MSVIEQRVITDHTTPAVIDLLTTHGMSVWVYRSADWFVLDPQGPHVAHEAWTVKFDPTPIDSFSSVSDNVAKIVGVSDDYDAVENAAPCERFGDHVSAARSQPYYVDVTNPHVNKGSVARYLSTAYKIPPAEIATIGDMPNDVLMFAQSGGASPWATRAGRYSVPPAKSPPPTRTRASQTRWSGSSCRDPGSPSLP